MKNCNHSHFLQLIDLFLNNSLINNSENLFYSLNYKIFSRSVLIISQNLPSRQLVSVLIPICLVFNEVVALFKFRFRYVMVISYCMCILVLISVRASQVHHRKLRMFSLTFLIYFLSFSLQRICCKNGFAFDYCFSENDADFSYSYSDYFTIFQSSFDSYSDEGKNLQPLSFNFYLTRTL